jgi:hypothetical protein
MLVGLFHLSSQGYGSEFVFPWRDDISYRAKSDLLVLFGCFFFFFFFFLFFFVIFSFCFSSQRAVSLLVKMEETYKLNNSVFA